MSCLSGQVQAQFGPTSGPPSAAARDAYIRQFRTKKARDEARATLARLYPATENASEDAVPSTEANAASKALTRSAAKAKAKEKAKGKSKTDAAGAPPTDPLPSQRFDPTQWRYLPFERGADRGYYQRASALPSPAITYLTEKYTGQTISETILLENPAGRCVWEVTLPGKLLYFTDTGTFLREKSVQ